MRFTTITTRRDGVCRRCKHNVPAGTRVRYNGYGIWHLAADCPGAPVAAPTPIETCLGHAAGNRAVYAVGEDVSFDVAAPGIGKVTYRVTRIDGEGAWGVVVNSTVRELTLADVA